MRSPTFAIVTLALLLPAGRAAASTNYPDYVVQKLQLTNCPPTCLLCHATASGGPGNLNTTLGARMKTGMVGGMVTGKLDVVLAELETMKVDTDADGTPDITELREGNDPVVAGGSLCGGPQYGCGAATIAPSRPDKGVDPLAATAGMLSLAVGLLFWRRRTT